MAGQYIWPPGNLTWRLVFVNVFGRCQVERSVWRQCSLSHTALMQVLVVQCIHPFSSPSLLAGPPQPQSSILWLNSHFSFFTVSLNTTSAPSAHRLPTPSRISSPLLAALGRFRLFSSGFRWLRWISIWAATAAGRRSTKEVADVVFWPMGPM